jgi:AraC-like DNA-binding protein
MLIVLPPEVRQFEQLLQEKLLPWIKSEAPIILFDAPPRALAPVAIQEKMTPPLSAIAKERAYPHVQRWREEKLNAICAPMLGCVFDGEADYRVHRPPGKQGGQWTLSLKAGTFFMIAPGTPFSDGSQVAWERAEPQKAYSRAILMQLRPEGVICHSFTSDKGKLWLHPYLFIYDFEILPLGEKVLGEMNREHPPLPIIYLYWELMMRLLMRAISEGNVSVLHSPLVPFANNEDISMAAMLQDRPVVHLAEQYIKSNLADSKLRVSDVALHAGLSERHLNRLFKGTIGLTLSAFIQQKRLEKASALLKHSNLTVHQVANYCGFSHLPHFTTWFSRQTHLSPIQFRQKNKKLLS